ncbi:MAG: cation:proton antiporter [Ilumatobacteraceae bacterium]
MDSYPLLLAFVGIVALLTAWLPAYLERRPLSLPIILVLIGMAAFRLPWLTAPDPRDNLGLTAHLTELGVLVSLMGAGLKIDRVFGWRTWNTTRRLLIVAMPLTIVLIGLLGLWIGGLSLAGAALLGSALAPTDPVLAADVQVGAPTVYDPQVKEDEVRFALTSEAGLNDALAFPFVWGAIALAGAAAGEVHRGALGWLGIDVGYRLLVGGAVGWLVGRTLARIFFKPPGPLTALADRAEGFVAIASTLLAYGTTELAHGYGFMAVFVTAVTLRSGERQHEFHVVMHEFARQVEEMLMVALLLLFGGALSHGLLDHLTWQGFLVALLGVFVVRPIAAGLALVRTTVRPFERRTIGFFGVRGIGSLFYLSFALGQAPFEDADALWSMIASAVVLSILVHGVAATPVMERLDRRRRARDERRRLLGQPVSS